jgi:hypothetical protein
MRCDYYIQTEIVFEYLAKNCKIYTIYTNRTIKKGFVFNYHEEDSNDDLVTKNNKFQAELERKIKENTYDKILFKNGKWIDKSYKKKYENSLNETCRDFSQLLRVYKKITAIEIL